jgi:hypothetical protein
MRHEQKLRLEKPNLVILFCYSGIVYLVERKDYCKVKKKKKNTTQ